MIGCNHNDFSIVGDITVINRNIKLGHNVTIYPNVMFWGDGEIVIGDNVDIGNGTVIYASKTGGVTIGNNTNIAAQCYIIDMDHGIKDGELICNQENTVEKVTIGSDCWIAAGCKVLKGSHIKDGTVIGALSLVKGEIPENAIAFGIQAKVKGIA
ncbi:MAG: acyltransferase [Candidatus Fimenecus sp.]|nr:acyltransferase [Candidatus Fimenecus sp.]